MSHNKKVSRWLTFYPILRLNSPSEIERVCPGICSYLVANASKIGVKSLFYAPEFEKIDCLFKLKSRTSSWNRLQRYKRYRLQ